MLLLGRADDFQLEVDRFALFQCRLIRDVLGSGGGLSRHVGGLDQRLIHSGSVPRISECQHLERKTGFTRLL